ncbi:type VII secretion integral membrane protein EccD [Nonomuraea thailandensis]|uniref:Type VII secretion integral membrane protein EccD n=1 Tax=Nonomuraea thailandensis TaxID=1188745 RepID=A0A9X2GQ93_9ACTN|nr:type VII secretion integral membrane protein EccD [Nonomuraea thailandensis]MCP2361947.1 type VII secretion integral membrane protein EccD [Nonomuraea thailandensis]
MTSLAEIPPSPHGLHQMPAPLPPLCHVTVVGPRRKADLALPADIPLPHVLPGLLRAMGELGGETAAAPGWTLQRIGGPPFDLGQSLSQLGVLDGEILYLRPRQVALPPARFDDVADVVATGVREGRGSWEARHTRAMGGGAACGLLLAGVVALALGGLTPLVTAIVAGALALVLVGVGVALSRAVGHAGAGAVIGHAALPYAFLAGLLAPAAGGGLGALGSPQVLGALACTALVATLGGTAIAGGVPGFLGTAIASMVGAVCAAVVMVTGASPGGVAAVAAAVVMAFGPLVPVLSFRLARVPLPTMPTNAEELRGDNQNLDSASVLQRTGAAQRYATGLIVAICLVGLGAHALLLAEGTWIAAIMSVVLALAQLMRARVFQGVGQRMWLMLVGFGGLAAVGVEIGVVVGGLAAVGVLLGLLWTAMIVVGMGVWLPDGRLSPFWGRAADIVEWLLIVALVPLALGVLDVYAWVRGLGG